MHQCDTRRHPAQIRSSLARLLAIQKIKVGGGGGGCAPLKSSPERFHRYRLACWRHSQCGQGPCCKAVASHPPVSAWADSRTSGTSSCCPASNLSGSRLACAYAQPDRARRSRHAWTPRLVTRIAPPDSTAPWLADGPVLPVASVVQAQQLLKSWHLCSACACVWAGSCHMLACFELFPAQLSLSIVCYMSLIGSKARRRARRRNHTPSTAHVSEMSAPDECSSPSFAICALNRATDQCMGAPNAP